MLAEPMAPPPTEARPLSLREHLYVVIFESDTPAGKLFDIVLLVVIIASVVTVMLESIGPLAHEHLQLLHGLEWIYTVLFSIEYVLRVYSARRRLRYVLSFFGVIDLFALLPSFIDLLFPGVRSLMVIRALRLLRVFRVLKAVHLLREAHRLLTAIRNSLPKISVFLGTVTIIAVVFGAAMYVIEGPAAGFTSIPRGMYWAIVTMTTVGYGDIAPQTALGQVVAACLMTLGYGILAVPTGILSAELVRPSVRRSSGEPTDDELGHPCPVCGAEGHPTGAHFCYSCGSAVQ
jgi:voltage-gated potassium channel